MAQRTVVAYHSDLSGAEIDDNGVGVQFSLDGTVYEIDLAPEEESALREALAPFVAAARTAGNRTSGSGPTAQLTQPEKEPPSRVLRAWAMENGFDVPARGRVPELVREAYRAAHWHREVTSIKRLLEPVSRGA